MTKNLTFDVRYDNELAHQYYGDGEKLTKNLENVYQGKNLQFPKDYDSTSTWPPIHFMSVKAPDDVDVDGLKNVHVPSGLNVEIIDFED
ncbi:hypothetical protein AbraIFM66951_000647 [Aspergillus brasiliensis]|uniref:Uncharacterized protein n=1 Tax=Aspergillus brasiliensis TaxID=319629 RepID=A0A9W5YWQ3_9EURO|nr:hypothetical protein AbraCBS73388_001065 [Aspergillus brasiliensis]GKZ48569.1 hypothetical protein AbraIFM66951_000647 [Aspergillus brasiliensis]